VGGRYGRQPINRPKAMGVFPTPTVATTALVAVSFCKWRALANYIFTTKAQRHQDLIVSG
jgi:hypothetical protein